MKKLIIAYLIAIAMVVGIGSIWKSYFEKAMQRYHQTHLKKHK